MKVCHMTSAHPAEDVRIFYKECTSLAKAGYEVYLVARGESYDKNGVHIVGVGEISGNRLKRMTEGAKKVYQKAAELDCDIYHFHDPELLPCGLKLKKKGKKVIFDSHERYTYQLRSKPYLPSWVTVPMAALYGLYEKSVIKKLDAVIFPCLKDGRHPFEGLCRRVCAVNNVPLMEEMYDNIDPKIPKYQNSVVYVGGLTHERGITHLIKAAAESGATAYLAGTFSSEDYEKSLQSMAEFSCVNYMGKLNRQEVCQLLQHCQIGMANILNVGQYNQYDNLATKTYEYMALGIPVILTKANYNVKIIEKYQFGICVDPENVDEIADAIRYLLDHPDEARKMGENGRRAVEREFNWGVEEEKLLDLYSEMGT